MEEKNILKKLDEINIRMINDETRIKEFMALVGESNQLINQLKELEGKEK